MGGAQSILIAQDIFTILCNASVSIHLKIALEFVLLAL
jgi:hypothetical protein